MSYYYSKLTENVFMHQGNGDHGKLGQGSEKKITVPRRVESFKKYKVVRVASYNEHTAALVQLRDDVGYCPSSVPVSTAYLQSMRRCVCYFTWGRIIFFSSIISKLISHAV